VLSVALLHVDATILPENNAEAYNHLLQRACFVKFNALEQMAKKRTMDRSTMDWWSKQGEAQRKMSFIPSKDDSSVEFGIRILKDYFFSFENAKNLPIWVRGSLDQPVFESLFRAYDIKPFVHYNCYRDIRTAIEILYTDTAKGGYVDVPGLDPALVNKHDPVADCAYDALMLLRGKQ